MDSNLRNALRTLHELVTTHAGSYGELVGRYVARGCELFGMETGIASRIGEDYLIEAAQSPLAPIVVGARLALQDTYGAAVVREGRTVSYADVSAVPALQDHYCTTTLRLVSTISTPIRVDGALYGTLSFSSQQARPRPFAPWEHELIELMAGALGRFIERAHREAAREEAHRALAVSEARHRALFQHSTDAIALHEEDGTLVEVNARFLALVGRPREGVLGQPIDAFVIPTMAADGMLRADGVSADGSRTPLEVSVTRFELEDRPVSLCILRDITERLRSERRKAELVSVISHEIRTPLTAVRGALSLMAAGVVGTMPPEAGEMVKVALSGTERLVRLVNDLLDLDSLEAGRLSVYPTTLQVNPAMETVWQNMAILARSAGIRLDNRIPDDCEVVADADRLAQVLVNLIGNAIKFSPSGSVVILEEHRGDHHTELRVIDQGPGVPEGQRLAIFERFHQLNTAATRSAKGSGLGLHISRALVEAMGGQIGVAAASRSGATFFFTLPRPAEVSA